MPQLPADATYLACPRCGLALRKGSYDTPLKGSYELGEANGVVVMKGSYENGSPLCPDCREADGVIVRMDLVKVPPKPSGSTRDKERGRRAAEVGRSREEDHALGGLALRGSPSN